MKGKRWYERGFIAISCECELAGALFDFLGYDGNGDSVALEKVGRDRLPVLRVSRVLHARLLEILSTNQP